MTKILGIFAASALSLGVLAGCGSGGEAATEPTPEVSVSEAASPSPVSAVDTYCQQVEDYAAKAGEIAENPTTESAEELRKMAEDLQQAASELTQELMDDPAQATRVQECTTQLQEALAS